MFNKSGVKHKNIHPWIIIPQVCRSESLIIRTDKGDLDLMDEWCTQHHGHSGLTQACLDSQVPAI